MIESNHFGLLLQSPIFLSFFNKIGCHGNVFGAFCTTKIKSYSTLIS